MRGARHVPMVRRGGGVGVVGGVGCSGRSRYPRLARGGRGEGIRSRAPFTLASGARSAIARALRTSLACAALGAVLFGAPAGVQARKVCRSRCRGRSSCGEVGSRVAQGTPAFKKVVGVKAYDPVLLPRSHAALVRLPCSRSALSSHARRSAPFFPADRRVSNVPNFKKP